MMDFGWVVSPITQYSVMGLAITGFISLWARVQFELHAVRIDLEKSRNLANAGLNALTADFEVLRGAQKDDAPVAWLNQPSRTLTMRMQILRMHRRGESIETITGALQIARNEVELTLKLMHLNECPK